MMFADLPFALLAQTSPTTAATQVLEQVSLFKRMFPAQSMALTVLIVSIVGASGLLIGSFRIRGFALGIPGVMFTGLIAGKLLGEGMLSEQVIQFVRDFGLIMFVYAVGVQVGPGFFASLRSQGLWWNLLAVLVVLLGAIICVAIGFILPNIGINGAVGLFAGATTNAPAFASASEAIRSVMGLDAGTPQIRSLTSPAFAIAYPFGLLGVIIAMVATRIIFRASPAKEAELADAMDRGGKQPPSTLNVEITNPNLAGMKVDDLEHLQGHGVVISRVMHQGDVRVPRPETTVQPGDVVLAVGVPGELEAFRLIAGKETSTDLREMPGEIQTREILVTHHPVLNKTVDELNLPQRFGVTITRVRRGELQFTAAGHVELHFGDTVRAVGHSTALDAAAKELGNSVRELNHPRLLPIFVGLVLGVILGSILVPIPGLPVPVKLGLAAGPMLVAIMLARLGRFSTLLWYMPFSASQLMRELGITMFLIGVGLLAGHGFFNTLTSPLGLQLLLLGTIVTLVPLMIIGLVARYVFKTNYLHICGILAGSMTSPSLAFVHTMTSSQAPAVAFATVYPLTMILRVLMGQLLVLIFGGH